MKYTARHINGGGGMALFESFPLSECVKLLRTCLYAFIHLAISFFWLPFFLVLLSDVDILTWQSLEQRMHDISVIIRYRI